MRRLALLAASSSARRQPMLVLSSSLSTSTSSSSSSFFSSSSSSSSPPPRRRVLVLNAGSSSLKLKLFEEGEASSLVPVASALVERLGTDAATLRSWRARTTTATTTTTETTSSSSSDGSSDANGGEKAPRPVSAADLRAALAAALPSLGLEAGSDLFACGHRVVHGGELSASREWPGDGDGDDDETETEKKNSTSTSTSTRAAVAAATALAPLHNPRNVEGIDAALELFPRATHVAVFDTAFHVASLPPEAFTYALPRAMRTLGGGGGGRNDEKSSLSSSSSSSSASSSSSFSLSLPVPIRKYGFHGSSFKHAVRATSQLLGLPLPRSGTASSSSSSSSSSGSEEDKDDEDDGNPPGGCLDAVAFHLGAGASACAIRGGRSVDTSLGATPLQGLVMATRCGDVDPAVPLMVASEWEERERERRERGGGGGGKASSTSSVVERVLSSLNKEAGLAALAGPGVAPAGDMRDVIAAAAAATAEESGSGSGNGNETESEQAASASAAAAARLALSVYVHRIRHYLGAYLLNRQLNGRVHAIIFTGGVGENSPLVRERALEGLEHLGIAVDAARNAAAVGVKEAVRIDAFANDGDYPSSDSRRKRGIAIVVVPADEEAVIARDAWEIAVRKSRRK